MQVFKIEKKFPFADVGAPYALKGKWRPLAENKYQYLIIEPNYYHLLWIENDAIYLNQFRKMILQKDIERLNNIYYNTEEDNYFANQWFIFLKEFLNPNTELNRFSLECAAEVFESYLRKELQPGSINFLMTHPNQKIRELAKKASSQK